ncbi:MAG TPA: efflux RND transporter periplasmic adaptor subunit [Gammaproteobacteria bacterium]|nr:efflux RND transporter periplasmic adaptor subunit [Gammaproteobacteria bacterium]
MSATNAESVAPPRRVAAKSYRRIGIFAAAIALVAVLATLYVRQGGTRSSTSDSAQPTVVAVAEVRRSDLVKEIAAPAEFRPYTEVNIYAKVAGYVSRIDVDVGDQVTKGDLIAILEVPEIKDDLDHALAAYNRTEADYKDAHLSYTRLLAANREHANLIAQQDLDTGEARDAAAAGALAAAKADVDKYRTLNDYARITAPFGGIVTKRYADPGALIQAGTSSNTQTMPLIRLSENRRLRLDFPVPVDYVSRIRDDSPVMVRVDSLGGRTFASKIARFTHRVDESTRTMMTEVEVGNDALDLVPGMYATVTLKIDEHRNALAVPIEAVPSGATTVFVVNSSQRIEERQIKVGLETATQYEVLEGLEEGDRVVIGNSAQLQAGQQVEAKVTERPESPQ